MFQQIDNDGCHIPDKGQVMVRYYGLYSNAHRGKARKRGTDPLSPPIIEEEHFAPSKGWAEMIRKVYETDPLLCPRCGGEMRIIAFIEDHKVIDRIIRHLKLTFEAERPPLQDECKVTIAVMVELQLLRVQPRLYPFIHCIEDGPGIAHTY